MKRIGSMSGAQRLKPVRPDESKKRLEWTLREEAGEWVAESGTGITVYADKKEKILDWLK